MNIPINPIFLIVFISLSLALGFYALKAFDPVVEVLMGTTATGLLTILFFGCQSPDKDTLGGTVFAILLIFCLFVVIKTVVLLWHLSQREKKNILPSMWLLLHWCAFWFGPFLHLSPHCLVDFPNFYSCGTHMASSILSNSTLLPATLRFYLTLWIFLGIGVYLLLGFFVFRDLTDEKDPNLRYLR